MRKQFTLILMVFFAVTIFAQKTEIDKRAFNYYSVEQLNQMPDVKIKQINYLYQESFVIPEEFKEVINADGIDIRDYSKYRLPDERVKVAIKNKNATKESYSNSKYYMYLISINELKQAYKELK